MDATLVLETTSGRLDSV